VKLTYFYPTKKMQQIFSLERDTPEHSYVF